MSESEEMRDWFAEGEESARQEAAAMTTPDPHTSATSGDREAIIAALPDAEIVDQASRGRIADAILACIAQRGWIKPEASMGVGDGSGQRFVHGDYESIKAAQAIVLRAAAAEAIVHEWHQKHRRMEMDRDAALARAEKAEREVAAGVEVRAALVRHMERIEASAAAWQQRAEAAERVVAAARDWEQSDVEDVYAQEVCRRLIDALADYDAALSAHPAGAPDAAAGEREGDNRGA